MVNDMVIGKFALESLTTGMYNDPSIIFREYIQNSADAIDDAIEMQYFSTEDSEIKVIVDSRRRSIEIVDNGIGIKSNEVKTTLLNIGNSRKDFRFHKGFRGIGRLSGLSYCEVLTFETSFKGEPIKSTVKFDAKKLTGFLKPGEYNDISIQTIIEEIVDIQIEECQSEIHFFKVKLNNVSRSYDLLDIKKVQDYIEQVAPLPFNLSKFKLGQKIEDKITEIGHENRSYNIYIGKTEDKIHKLYKPYKSLFISDMSKSNDSISDIHFEVIRDDFEKKNLALVWYGKCELLGSVADIKVKGLRLRKSGVLIGDRFSLSHLFKEERFNGWIQGEVIVFDKKLVPNGRRDDFEKNDDYLSLLERLQVVTESISNEIRKKSSERNKLKNQTITKNDNLNQNVSDEKKVFFLKLENLINEATRYNNDMMENITKIVENEVDQERAKVIISKIEQLLA